MYLMRILGVPHWRIWWWFERIDIRFHWTFSYRFLRQWLVEKCFYLMVELVMFLVHRMKFIVDIVSTVFYFVDHVKTFVMYHIDWDLMEIPDLSLDDSWVMDYFDIPEFDDDDELVIHWFIRWERHNDRCRSIDIVRRWGSKKSARSFLRVIKPKPQFLMRKKVQSLPRNRWTWKVSMQK